MPPGVPNTREEESYSLCESGFFLPRNRYPARLSPIELCSNMEATCIGPHNQRIDWKFCELTIIFMSGAHSMMSAFASCAAGPFPGTRSQSCRRTTGLNSVVPPAIVSLEFINGFIPAALLFLMQPMRIGGTRSKTAATLTPLRCQPQKERKQHD